MKKMITFRTARAYGRSILLVIMIFTVGIPTMINAMKANIKNDVNKYGTYTLETIQELHLEDPAIDKIALEKVVDVIKNAFANGKNASRTHFLDIIATNN